MLFLLLRLLWISVSSTAATADDDRPNIVFIMLDDLGWSNVGFHNPALLTTPFLDKMAKSEHTIELTNVYSTHRCSPSRAAALTGVYPHRYGMGAAALKPIYVPEAMDKGLTMLPQVMKEGGYETHMVGKWHLGMSEEYDLPHNKGFESFYGMLESQMDYTTHLMGHMALMFNNSEPIDRSGEYITTVLTDEAMKFVKNQKTPIFTYLAYNAPHQPVSAPDWIKTKLQEEYKKRGIHRSKGNLEYDGAIRIVDMGIEKLYNEAAKLDRETIFIFTSDNGGADASDACNYPYRGGKSRFEEGGIKAPTLIMSTKRTFPQRQSTKLFHFTDWFSTILGLGRVKVPETNHEWPVDGLDFSGDLGEDKPAVKRDNFIVGVRHVFQQGRFYMQYAARYGRYKFYNFVSRQPMKICRTMPRSNSFIPDASRTEAVTQAYINKFLQMKHKSPSQYGYSEFYDLQSDPFELINLSSHQNYKGKIAETRKWAEAEIGRPKLAVVGGWNDAYPNMVKSIMKEAAIEIDDLLPNEKAVPKWWRHTGRVKLVETCNQRQQCSKKYYSKTGWPSRGIERDFAALDKRLAVWKAKGTEARRINRIMHWAALCGELCCPWRERHGFKCKNEYASNPFAYSKFSTFQYNNLYSYPTTLYGSN